jgi:hypothetical protein
MEAVVHFLQLALFFIWSTVHTLIDLYYSIVPPGLRNINTLGLDNSLYKYTPPRPILLHCAAWHNMKKVGSG